MEKDFLLEEKRTRRRVLLLILEDFHEGREDGVARVQLVCNYPNHLEVEGFCVSPYERESTQRNQTALL